MKKLLLLALALIIGACSTSDSPDQDQIIGVWKPIRDVEVYKNGTEEIDLPSVCELKNRFTFKEDGTFTITDFPESDDPNCEENVGNLYLSGEWMKISESKYRFEFTCMMPDCEKITEIPDEITFPNSNIMIVRFNESDPEEDVDYYYTELSRVQ